MEVIVHQAPLSMGFSRREYWSKLPFPPPEDLPKPGIEPSSLMSPVLAGRFFITSTTWEAPSWNRLHSKTRRAIATATAKSLQSCLALCDPIDGSPPGSSAPGILQARTLEWAAISFSNAWEWKVNVKSLSRVWLLATPWTAAHQAPPSVGFSRQEDWSGLPLPSRRQICNILCHKILEPRCCPKRGLWLAWVRGETAMAWEWQEGNWRKLGES